MRTPTLIFAAIALATGAAAADDPFAAPLGLHWGALLDDMADYSEAERRDGTVSVRLGSDRLPADTQEAFGFVCDGAGLQQVQFATVQYDRYGILPRWGRMVDRVATQYGPPDSRENDRGVAYWGDRIAVEAYPSSKTKFVVVASFHGPVFEDCGQR